MVRYENRVSCNEYFLYTNDLPADDSLDCEEDAVGKEVKPMMQSLASMDSMVVLRVPFFNVDDVPGCIIFRVTLWIVKRMLSLRKLAAA